MPEAVGVHAVEAGSRLGHPPFLQQLEILQEASPLAEEHRELEMASDVNPPCRADSTAAFPISGSKWTCQQQAD